MTIIFNKVILGEPNRITAVTISTRITASGDRRVTADSDTRITTG